MIVSYLRRNYAWFGLASAALVSLCALAAALFYRGPEGEPYSLLHHFVSELGEVGVSPLAGLFNLGLIAGGLLLIPFCVGLGLALPGWVAKAGLIAGLAAALSLAGVGLFPMNHLAPHITAALAYFRTGLATVVLFGQAILFQPPERVVLNRWASLASLATAACYAAFILYMGLTPMPAGMEVLDPRWRAGRPSLWPLAALEWLVFFSTILWFAAIALAARRERQAALGDF